VTVWNSPAVDEKTVTALVAETGIPKAIVSILVRRGITDTAAIDKFLSPRLSDLSDPFELQDMRKAVERIGQAIQRHEEILIHGDFDADGVTGTAVLTRTLRKLGATVIPFLPNRLSEGYGLTEKGLKRCIAGSPSARLLVTVDCGTNAADVIRGVMGQGIDVVVTDHHELTGDIAPATALVNPKRGKDPRTEPLAGVGVAFKLCHGLVKEGAANSWSGVKSIDLREYLDIVAAGTVADVVPLCGENRTLVRHGLMRMNSGPCMGLKALIDVAGVKTAIDSYHLGFIIGPRLNAAGRMASADTALELLLTEDGKCAEKAARDLDNLNRERKNIEDRIMEQAAGQAGEEFDESRSFGLVCGARGWHVGAIGIVASGICGRYRRPAVVIGFDENGMGRGSCRSVESMDIIDALTDCRELLVSFGGHRMAAGLSIEESNFDEFKKRFNASCRKKLKGVDLRPVRTVDAWIGLREADDRLLQGLQMLQPFGLGNPTPVFGAKGVTVVSSPRVVGNGHLKMAVASGGTQMDAIAFGMGEAEVPDGPIDVLFQLQENTYCGRRTLQLNVKDFRPAEGK